MNLLGREFTGIVLETVDPLNQGRYKVSIPQLQPLSTEDVTIWVRNHIHKYRHTSYALTEDSGNVFYGQYFPIQPSSRVIVKFSSQNDLSTGYIDRLLDDDYEPNTIDDKNPNQYKHTLPFNTVTENRDEIYQIIRTPKHDSLFLISENTKQNTEVPENSIHLYREKLTDIFIIDDLGFHWVTPHNEYHSIGQDYSIKIGDNYFKDILHNSNIRIGGEYRLSVHHDMNIRSTDGNVYLQADNNSINLLSHRGSINHIASDYVTISAYSGTTSIYGLSKLFLCTKDLLRLIGKQLEMYIKDNALIVSKDKFEIQGKPLHLTSEEKIIIEAPKIKFKGDTDYSDDVDVVSLFNDDYYDTLEDPVTLDMVEDGFLDNYELDQYIALPEDDIKPNYEVDDVNNCNDVHKYVYNNMPLTAIVSDPFNPDKPITKYIYDESDEQQIQSKFAEKLFEIESVIAQKSHPPEPKTIIFEQ